VSAPIVAPVADLVGLLAEQRHQLLDLDSDSQCPMPGAACVACPPKTTEEAS
jgi:hypothetical protein